MSRPSRGRSFVKRPGSYLLTLSVLVTTSAAAQTQQTPGFTQKIEVNVRTVLAVVTDAKGRPLERPLSVEDVEVLEDGVPAKVLGVDPISPAAQPAPSAGIHSSTEPTFSPPVTSLPQILYVDASLLQFQSAKRIAKAMEKDLDAILARGPLEIVLADPTPKVFLASTSERGRVESALQKLEKVPGRERIRNLRQRMLESPPVGNFGRPAAGELLAREGALRSRASGWEEIKLLQQSFGRLERWAAERPVRRPSVLYLANDGFDANVAEFYGSLLNQGDKDAVALNAELQTQVPPMIARLASVLANEGLTTIAIAVGGLAADQPDLMRRPQGITETLNEEVPIFTFVRPLEPLRLIAHETGGEVLTREDRFGQVLDRLAHAVAITYRMEKPPDGRPHRLEVVSRREGVVLRAARSVVAGTSEMAAASRAIQALGEPAAAGLLRPQATVEATGIKKDRRRSGVIHVSADLASVADAIAKVGPGRIRVTIAVQVEGAQPFVHHEEMSLTRAETGTLWLFDAPVEWPPEAQRVAITVEELKTGARGTAVAELPR